MCQFGTRLLSGGMSRRHIAGVIEFIGRTQTAKEA